MTSIAKRGLRGVLFEVAAMSFEQGVGYFQQTVILKETARRLGMDRAGDGACELLMAWHRLLATGFLDPVATWTIRACLFCT